jgi:MoaA/NifB/PqqE/SkfB family radical SAM enzyme
MAGWEREIGSEARRIVSHPEAIPQALEFHPGRSCPLSCNFCHTSRAADTIYAQHEPTAVLTSGQVGSILRAFADYGGAKFVLSGGLEPFMSPLAARSLAEAKAVGLSTNVYTSGLGKYLTDQSLSIVVENSDRLRFSLSAGTSRTYRSIYMPGRGVEAADRAFRHVRDMVRIAKTSAESTDAKIGVHFLLQEENLQEWKMAAEHWIELGVHFIDLRLDIVPQRRLPIEVCQRIKEEVTILQRHSPGTAVDFRFLAARLDTAPASCYAWRSSIVLDAFGGMHVCCITADRPSDLAPFGLGYIRSGEDLKELLRQLKGHTPLSPHCSVCSDRTWLLNSLVESEREGGKNSQTALLKL